MADATVKGWRCETCGKVFRENDCGYSADYSLIIKANTSPDYSGYNERYGQICSMCMSKIDKCLNELAGRDDVLPR